MLQQHGSLKTIKKKLIRKALDMIRKLAEEDPDEANDSEKKGRTFCFVRIKKTSKVFSPVTFILFTHLLIRHILVFSVKRNLDTWLSIKIIFNSWRILDNVESLRSFLTDGEMRKNPKLGCCTCRGYKTYSLCLWISILLQISRNQMTVMKRRDSIPSSGMNLASQ